MIEPIKPDSEAIANSDNELNLAIDYINNNLINRNWHKQYFPVEGYKAIILSPYGEYIDVMDRVVDKFKEAGWDCLWGMATDVRGPHYCFYVNELHFTKECIPKEVER